jgi:hypothetical protein
MSLMTKTIIAALTLAALATEASAKSRQYYARSTAATL